MLTCLQPPYSMQGSIAWTNEGNECSRAEDGHQHGGRAWQRDDLNLQHIWPSSPSICFMSSGDNEGTALLAWTWWSTAPKSHRSCVALCGSTSQTGNQQVTGACGRLSQGWQAPLPVAGLWQHLTDRQPAGHWSLWSFVTRLAGTPTCCRAVEK